MNDIEEKYLPIYPNNMLEYFDYGEIIQNVHYAEADHKANITKQEISKIKKMSGRTNVTVKDVFKARNEIDMTVGDSSPLSRFFGFVSFINMMWLISIIGMAISILPALY